MGHDRSHATSTAVPAVQTVPLGAGGSELPLSANRACVVFTYVAPALPSPVCGNRPPATPQLSITGAMPGDLHGLSVSQPPARRQPVRLVSYPEAVKQPARRGATRVTVTHA
jgi:hypothetical protein